jgi:hypothetical protein
MTVTGQSAGTPEPMHIHKGTCATLDPKPAYGLPTLIDGKSESTVKAPLRDLQMGDTRSTGTSRRRSFGLRLLRRDPLDVGEGRTLLTRTGGGPPLVASVGDLFRSGGRRGTCASPISADGWVIWGLRRELQPRAMLKTSWWAAAIDVRRRGVGTPRYARRA